MIAIGSDHGGYALKQEIMAYLDKEGLEYKDYGCYSEASCDYPEFGHAVAPVSYTHLFRRMPAVSHISSMIRRIAVCGCVTATGSMPISVSDTEERLARR